MHSFCRATFDFAARSSRELSLRAGGAALVALRTEADADSAWWECADADGARGLVPTSYVVAVAVADALPSIRYAFV